MNSSILGLLAETSIHPGAGQDTGFVDLPVAREAATDYPVIAGSSFKGALLDRARDAGWDDDQKNRVFGKQESAGSILVSDARLVLLPVRSLTSHYKWVTCPHLLERLHRDLRRANCNGQAVDTTGPDKGHYLGAGPEALYLEEREFKRADASSKTDGIITLLGSLITHQATRDRLPEQLVILHNDDFAWFARYGLAVNARNVLDDVKKTSRNLWYEETIPPDSLFYCLLAERGEGALNSVRSLFANRPFLQVGGNETVGQGWFAVTERTGGAQ